MCVASPKAPVAPAAKVEKPVFIRNPYLDEKENKDGVPNRTGRADFLIPLETGIGFEGRGGTAKGTDGGTPKGNSAVSKPRRASDLTIGPGPKIQPGVTGGTGQNDLPGFAPVENHNRIPNGSPGRTIEGGRGALAPNDPRTLTIGQKRQLIAQQQR